MLQIIFNNFVEMGINQILLNFSFEGGVPGEHGEIAHVPAGQELVSELDNVIIQDLHMEGHPV